MRLVSVIYTVCFIIIGFFTANAQYEVGDYYVNGNIKGIVFFVSEDEGTLYLLKTDMEGRYQDYGIGDFIDWGEKEFIIQNANRDFPYTVWDIPNQRIARLIFKNNRIISKESEDLGYKRLPIEAFLDGKVTYEGTGQRLIPVFWPRCYGDESDIFDTKSESLLLSSDGKTGILLYGIVDYNTGTMKKLH